MDRVELEDRTKAFALSVMQFVGSMPKTRTAEVLSHQLLRSGTSIGANYREANRAESRDDFIHKIAIVEKEASESHYWLELCDAAGIGEKDTCKRLLNECSELLAIFTAAGRTAKARRESRNSDSGMRTAGGGQSHNSQSIIRNPRLP